MYGKKNIFHSLISLKNLQIFKRIVKCDTFFVKIYLFVYFNSAYYVYTLNYGIRVHNLNFKFRPPTKM